MSKAIKQLFVLAFVVAISLVFVLTFRPGTDSPTGSTGPRCVVEIESECVPHAEYLASLRLTTPSGLDEAQFKQLGLDQLRPHVIDGLLERFILLKDAERLGITVSDDEVTRHIAKGLARVSLPAAKEEYYTARLAGIASQQNGAMAFIGGPPGPSRQIPVMNAKTEKFDYDKYKRTVPRITKLTEADFRLHQRKEAIAARVRAIVKARVRVSESEARRKFDTENEKVIVDFVRLERQYYSEYAIDQSQEALDKWAEANKDEVDAQWEGAKDDFLPECRQARHILIRVDANVADQDAAKKAAKDNATAARKRVTEGKESFADVAREVSEDTMSAIEGGSLGCFKTGKMVKPFEDAVFAMKEGDVSEVIETQHGMHVIQLQKIAKGDVAEKLGRSLLLKGLYLKKESERLASEGAKQIRAAVADGKSFEDAIDAHLQAVLLEGPKADYLAGKNGTKGDDDKPDKDGDDKPDKDGDDKGDDGKGDDKPKKKNAWTDSARPQVETSASFSIKGPPFGGAQNPSGAAKEIFQIEKPGEVTSGIIKLIDGYAVPQLKERQAVADEEWLKERENYMGLARRKKQRDALISYMRDLREKYLKEVTYHVKVDGEEAKDDEAP